MTNIVVELDLEGTVVEVGHIEGYPYAAVLALKDSEKLVLLPLRNEEEVRRAGRQLYGRARLRLQIFESHDDVEVRKHSADW